MADGIATISMPLFEVYAPDGAGAITIPLFYANTDATAGTVVLPLFTVAGQVSYGDGRAIFPIFTATGTGVVGRSSTGSAIFPLFTARGVGEAGGVGSVLFPMFDLASTGGPLPDIDGAVIVPLFELVSSGYVPPRYVDAVTGEDSSQVWVVNTANKAHSTYSNFEIRGMGKFGSSYFAITDDGIYELTGDDDADTTIDWSVYWPPTDGGTSRLKSTDAAYLNFRVDGDIRFVTVTDERSKRIHNKSLADSPDGLHRRRVSGTRGLRGQMWQYGVENLGDNNIDLTDVEIRLITLKRRLK